MRQCEALFRGTSFVPPLSDNPRTCGGSAVLSLINVLSLCR
jgi:hypothetical protein